MTSVLVSINKKVSHVFDIVIEQIENETELLPIQVPGLYEIKQAHQE